MMLIDKAEIDPAHVTRGYDLGGSLTFRWDAQCAGKIVRRPGREDAQRLVQLQNPLGRGVDRSVAAPDDDEVHVIAFPNNNR